MVTTAKGIQDQLLETVQAGQEAVLETVKSWVAAGQKWTAEAPALASRYAKVPTPADLVDQAYEFAEKLLASQHAFANEVLALTRPATPAAPTKKV